jgi:RecB family exonuclease
MSNPLDYDHSTSYLPEHCILKVSPSKFPTFINRPHVWYREVVLKEKGFDYSTSSVIGTIVHYIAERVAKKEIIDKDAITNYILKHEPNENYCPATVEANFEQMAYVLINEYVLRNVKDYFEVETRHFTEIYGGIFTGGTVDFLQGSMDDCMIGDYKTYNSKTKPKVIPQDYKYQLLVYAYILSKKGYNVSRIRLVYVNRNIDGGISEKTNKPLKSYPPEIVVLTEQVTAEDLEFIGSIVELCADSVIATTEYPQLTHVIWKDKRLQVEK